MPVNFVNRPIIKMTVHNAFLDSATTESSSDRFQRATKAAIMLSALLPRYAITYLLVTFRIVG